MNAPLSAKAKALLPDAARREPSCLEKCGTMADYNSNAYLFQLVLEQYAQKSPF